MKTIRKNKIYKEITGLWPNVDRMVHDAEAYLDDLTFPGEEFSFVQSCALKAAEKARDIDYTKYYTYEKLMTFCREFKNGLLGLERMKIIMPDGSEWTPEDGPFRKTARGAYKVKKLAKETVRGKYRELIDIWVYSHVH